MLALGALTIDLYLPAMSRMAAYFGSSMVAVSLTLSTYLVGAALGQFLGGALSDQLGRKKVAMTGLSLFALGSALIIVATRIEQVQALRILQGFGGGSTAVICLAMIRDIHPPRDVARRFATAAVTMLLAPLVAPLLGAFLTQFGWQFTFGFLLVYGVTVLTVYASWVPETRELTGERFSFAALLSGYREVWNFQHNGVYLARRFFLFSSFNSGVFLLYVTNAATIYMQHFGLSAYQFGALFSVNAMMMMTGNRAAHFLLPRVEPTRLVRWANLIQLAAVSIAVAVFLAGRETLWVIVPVMMVFVAGAGAINPTVSGTLISFFDKNSGSAASLNATSFLLGGAAIGGIAGYASKTFGHSMVPIFVVIVLCVLAGQLTMGVLSARIRLEPPG